MNGQMELVKIETLRDDGRIDLLPDNVEWLTGVLKDRNPLKVHWLLRQFLDIWLVYADDEEEEDKKQHAGRYAANLWLGRKIKQADTVALEGEFWQGNRLNPPFTRIP